VATGTAGPRQRVAKVGPCDFQLVTGHDARAVIGLVDCLLCAQASRQTARMFRSRKKNCVIASSAPASNCALAIRRFAPDPGIRGAVERVGHRTRRVNLPVLAKRLDQLDPLILQKPSGMGG